MNKISYPKINKAKLMRSAASKEIDSKNTFLKKPSQINKKKVKIVSFLRLVVLLLVFSAIIFGAYLIIKTSYIFFLIACKKMFFLIPKIVNSQVSRNDPL